MARYRNLQYGASEFEALRFSPEEFPRTNGNRRSRMRFPLGMTTKLSKYIAGKRMRGVEKFPLVMMLEPLHACNLTCTGCGRIREYKDTITEQITVEQCLKAVDECGSPIVSICGGEPMIYRAAGAVGDGNSRPRQAYLSLHPRHVH